MAGNDRSGHGAAAPALLCRAREAADDAVLDGEQAGAGPVGDAELAVDVLDVVADGLLADEQVAGDVTVGPALGDQAQHLDLPGGEPGRPSLAPRYPMPGRLQHRVDGLGVQPRRPRLATQPLGGVVLAQRAPVGSWLHHRVYTSAAASRRSGGVSAPPPTARG